VFTGLVQAVGRVVGFADGRLIVEAPDAWPGDPWAIGESIAVDGCCLTLIGVEGGLEFDVSHETLARTTFDDLGSGSLVNLERAMKASDRLGGHIVQGHVDTVGVLLARNGLFVFEVGAEYAKYLVDKGSIAVNGVSLTVVQPEGGRFAAALVPHTLAVTNLGGLQPGMGVNVEFDVLAKYALNPR
jgi:riboflavin synthase